MPVKPTMGRRFSSGTQPVVTKLLVAVLYWQVGAHGVRRSLVDIVKHPDLHSVFANVGDVDEGAFTQLAAARRNARPAHSR